MRYRGFEITSCYDTGIEWYNQQTGEDEICSGYFCEIYPAGDDQYANQLDAFCLAEGHEIADTTQGSLENGIIRYVDGHYGYLQEEKEEVRQKRTEELAGRLIGYLGETQEGAALYRILSRDIGMTDNEIRGMGYGALAPYFDREEYAKTIAEWMMDDGTESTLSGSWAVPFGNLQKRFGVDLKTDTDLRDRVSRVLYDQSDIVADFCMEEDRVRLDFFYSRCPHVYEHGAETAEPAMDQSM